MQLKDLMCQLCVCSNAFLATTMKNSPLLLCGYCKLKVEAFIRAVAVNPSSSGMPTKSVDPSPNCTKNFNPPQNFAKNVNVPPNVPGKTVVADKISTPPPLNAVKQEFIRVVNEELIMKDKNVTSNDVPINLCLKHNVPHNLPVQPIQSQIIRIQQRRVEMKALKNYRCNVCGHEYAYHKWLRRHMVKVHKTIFF